MSSETLPLDAHAHIAPQIRAVQLRELGACVFAVTRSLEEFEKVAERADPETAWGVGCHPGVPVAQRAFSSERFFGLLERTAVVGEVGLDGTSPVPMSRQREVLRAILAAVARIPRILSIHSYQATHEVLGELERQPVPGVILHWWLGKSDETRRALQLGCSFSVNASSVRKSAVMEDVPLDRVLTETDHPFGDRYGGSTRRPGAVSTVEMALARRYSVSHEEIRTQVWRNLGRQASDVGCSDLLPRSIRSTIAMVG
jgi:TatD DNase family protein